MVLPQKILVFIGTALKISYLEEILHHRIQTDSGAHQISCPIGTSGRFVKDRAPEG
jgi:hypothetical protein